MDETGSMSELDRRLRAKAEEDRKQHERIYRGRAEEARRELEGRRRQIREFHRTRYGVSPEKGGRDRKADHSGGRRARPESPLSASWPGTWSWCSGSRAASRASGRNESSCKRRSQPSSSPSSGSTRRRGESTWWSKRISGDSWSCPGAQAGRGISTRSRTGGGWRS